MSLFRGGGGGGVYIILIKGVQILISLLVKLTPEFRIFSAVYRVSSLQWTDSPVSVQESAAKVVYVHVHVHTVVYM